jgi:ribosomal protein L32
MGILADFREVLKGLKHKKVGEETINVCPKCGSKKIAHMNPWLYGITPRHYVCTECGYKGPIVMELTKTEETG